MKIIKRHRKMGCCLSNDKPQIVEQEYMHIDDVIHRDINKHFYGDNIYKIINIYAVNCTKLFVLTFEGPAPCDMIFSISRVPNEYKKLDISSRKNVDDYIKKLIKTYTENFYVGFEGEPPWNNDNITIYYISNDIKLTNTINIKLVDECVCLTDIIRSYINTLKQ